MDGSRRAGPPSCRTPGACSGSSTTGHATSCARSRLTSRLEPPTRSRNPWTTTSSWSVSPDGAVVTAPGPVDLNRQGQIPKVTLAASRAFAARAVVTSAARFGTRPIPLEDVDSEKANKHAVDVICQALVPSYLLILGSTDVVPHQRLTNPLYHPDDDDDKTVPSDLPYACEAPFGPPRRI